MAEYEVEESLLRKDLQEFIGKLLENELIEVTSSASATPEKSAPEKSKMNGIAGARTILDGSPVDAAISNNRWDFGYIGIERELWHR